MAGTIEMRLAAPADAAAIRDLTRAAYAKWVSLIGREPLPMTADYDAAVLAHRFDLLLIDGALAALIETVDESGTLLVENVAVSPDFQGQGLGSRLMGHAEAIALGLGVRRLRLYTNQRLTENIRLYSRLGYVIDSEEDFGGGTIRVNMSKSLAD